MSNSYWRTERLIVDAVDRRILQKSRVWAAVVSIVTDPDLLDLHCRSQPRGDARGAGFC